MSSEEYYDLIIQSVEKSLKKMGTDYLDLVMCPHGTSSPEETNIDEIHEAFYTLKKAGKVRALGLSAHSDSAGILRGAIDSGGYDAVMIAYNIVNGAYIDATLRDAYEKTDSTNPGCPHFDAVFGPRGTQGRAKNAFNARSQRTWKDY